MFQFGSIASIVSMESPIFSKRHFAPFAFPAALFSGSALLLFLVNFFVPSPYMDEIFHVDQMKRYCDGRFSDWNDKITTPPALYFVSYGIWKLANFVITYDCHSVAHLRFLNQIFLLILYVVVCDVLRLQRSSTDRAKIPIALYSTAINLCFFPVLYFTAFLYYTDVLSTLAVMAMYSFRLRRWPISSAVAGALSCAVRQTNIIWVAFCCYLSSIGVILEYFDRVDQKIRVGRQKRARENGNERVDEVTYENDVGAFLKRFGRFLRNSDFAQIWTLARNLIDAVWCYALVGIGFGVFVFWNGGVALGDRSAHQACAHLVQFWYWALFASIFGFAVIVNRTAISAVFGFIFRRPLSSMLLLVTILLTIYQFTRDHPYLLADNRHYTFYIWRRWFMRHWTCKYVLAPIYLCVFLAILHSLSRNSLWRLGFICSVFLVTVPNRLLEFRYFILPFFFWRLQVSPLSKRRLGIEFLMYFAINVLTFSLFLCKPFKWSNSDDWQRFMW